MSNCRASSEWINNQLEKATKRYKEDTAEVALQAHWENAFSNNPMPVNPTALNYQHSPADYPLSILYPPQLHNPDA